MDFTRMTSCVLQSGGPHHPSALGQRLDVAFIALRLAAGCKKAFLLEPANGVLSQLLRDLDEYTSESSESSDLIKDDYASFCRFYDLGHRLHPLLTLPRVSIPEVFVVPSELQAALGPTSSRASTHAVSSDPSDLQAAPLPVLPRAAMPKVSIVPRRLCALAVYPQYREDLPRLPVNGDGDVLIEGVQHLISVSQTS
jgi:hypothetical protein